MEDIRKVSDELKNIIAKEDGIKAQYAVKETETREITMDETGFILFRTLFDNDVVIKLIADQKIGNASTNKFDQEAIENAVKSAILAAESGTADEFYDIAPGMEPAAFNKGVLTPDIDKLMFRAKEFSDEIKNNYPKIHIMDLVFKYVKEHSIYRNTNGSEDEMTLGYYGISLEYAGNDGEKTSGLREGTFVTDNLDKPFIEMGKVREELVETQNSIDPAPVEGKFEGSVIFNTDALAQMLQFAVSVFTGDGVILGNESKWIGKIGQKVASDKFTLGFCPNDERVVVSEVHTKDGFRSEDYNLIEDGILKSYTTGLYAASKCKVERAKNSSFDVIVKAGNTSREDMIKSIDKGLIIGSISCGHPSANGEISGIAKNSFYIENGEIKHAVTETMVSFNLSDMLMNIEDISKETVCDGGSVLPYIKVSGIVISGK